MPNVAAINHLIRVLEEERHFFDMNIWIGQEWNDDNTEPLGTVACIGGHVQAMHRAAFEIDENRVDVAARVLGITKAQAIALFTPKPIDRTRADAIACLRTLAETGDVRWPHPDSAESRSNHIGEFA